EDIELFPLSYYLIIKGEYQRYKTYLEQTKIKTSKLYAGTSAICLAAHNRQAKIYHLLLKLSPEYNDVKFPNFNTLHYALMVDDLGSLKSALKLKQKMYEMVEIAIQYQSIRCLGYLMTQIESEKLHELNSK